MAWQTYWQLFWPPWRSSGTIAYCSSVCAAIGAAQYHMGCWIFFDWCCFIPCCSVNRASLCDVRLFLLSLSFPLMSKQTDRTAVNALIGPFTDSSNSQFPLPPREVGSLHLLLVYSYFLIRTHQKAMNTRTAFP